MRIEPAQTRWPRVSPVTVALAAVFLLCVSFYEFGLPQSGGARAPLCQFRRLTGKPCPTCGSTRLVVAAAGGHFAEAAAYNPLVFAAAVAGVALLVLRVGFRRRCVWITSVTSRRILIVALLLAVAANWTYLLIKQ